MMAAGAILSPLGLIICILIPTITIFFARRLRLSAGRLAAGYVGALFALAVAIAASSYVSPQDALSVWHVPPNHYWGALVELFTSTFVVAAFASIIGISLVEIPILIGLSSSGMDTAPWLIVASLMISTAFAILAYALMDSSSNNTFFGILGYAVVAHSVITIGFSLGARLPWAFHLKP